MQIGCEKCGTTYNLDERVLPPGGAPVQCTRCGHVFTAVPPQPRTGATNLYGKLTPAPVEPVGDGAAPGDTQRFGQVAAPNPRSTQVFGAVSRPPAQTGTEAPRSTQVFGAVGQQPPAAEAGRAPQMSGAPGTADAARNTQMFGAVGQPGAAAAGATRSTQMFGVAGSQGAAPATPGHSTQTFGAVGQTGRVLPEPPRSTQNFGAVGGQGAPGAGAPRSTQMFGAAGGQGASGTDAPRSTQTFGAVGGQGASGTEAQRSTQMFGAIGGQGAPGAGAPRSTQTFGAAGQQGAAPGATPRSTQMFGAAGSQAPAPTDAPRSTQMFGAAGSQAPAPTDAPRSTQMFGAAGPQPAPGRPQLGSIGPAMVADVPGAQSFGASGAAVPGAARTAPPAIDADDDNDPQLRTLPFGRLPATAQAQARGPATQPFGAAVQGAPSAPSRTSTGERVAPRRTTTGDQPARTEPFGALPPSVQADARQFLAEHGAAAPAADPYADDLDEDFESEAAAAPQPLSAAMPPPAMRGAPSLEQFRTRGPAAPAPAAPVSLPPEAPAPAPALPGLSAVDSGSADHDDAAALQARIQSRNRAALVGVAVLIVAAIGAVAFNMLAARRNAASAEVVAQVEAAMSLLRKDDGASRDQAVQQLRAILTAHPAVLEAQADLLMALAMQLDDARLEIKRMERDSDTLNRQIAKLKEEKTPSDWENRVNVMIDQLAALKKQSDPLIDRASALDQEVNRAFSALNVDVTELPPRDAVARLRAQALYFGVKGSDQALVTGERYRAQGGNDGWGAVAFAEYALNARVAPDTLSQAQAALDQVSSRDSSFLRTYVLSARLSMLERRYDVASNALDATIALNPNHQVARQLLQVARQAVEAGSP